jgi:probable HAF family extracellular repeat protein
MQVISWAFQVACILSMGSLAAGAAELYTLTKTSGLFWEGMDINEAGEVAGGHDNGIYYNGDYTTSIPPLGGSGHFTYSKFYAINNHQLMVGESTTGIVNDNTGPRRGFSFNAQNGFFRELGSLGGPTKPSNASGLNDSGLIVGESATTNGTHAVRFELDGTITDLGTLGGEGSSAADINEKGDIVGYAQNAEGSWRAFLLQNGGTMIDIGTLGGKESKATRINNKGQIVGSSISTNGEWHAFLYSDGEMKDLGTLGNRSEALGLNDDGVVVGASYLDNYPTAFVWYPGGPMRALSSVVKLPEGDQALWARSINNRGFIVANIFQPVGRTGIQYTAVLKPGAVSGVATNGEWQVTAQAPPGTQIRLESSPNLVDWTPVLTIAGENSGVHKEPLENSFKFFRGVVGSQ